METVSAYEARVKFGNLLNRVYYGGTSFIIERYGTPLANLVPPAAETKKKRTKEKSKAKTKKRKESAMDKLMKFAGIWVDEDTERMKREIRAWRNIPERVMSSLDLTK